MMKQLYSLLIVSCVAVLLFIGCSKEAGLTVSNENVQPRQQFRPGQELDPCDAANLVLFVDPCFLVPARADVLAGINAAINNYNNVANVGINIVLVFEDPPLNGEEIDIRIECNDLLIEDFNANGRVVGGNLIQIDTNGPGFPGCPVNVCFHTNTVMHELGHILGLGHTQDPNDGELVPGTTVGMNSVFVGGDCNSAICAFSAGDITALEFLYPCLCSGTILGPDFLCVNQSGEFCLSEDVDDVVWSITGGSIVTTTDNCVQVVFSETGNRFISAQIRINNCEYFLTKCVRIGAPSYPEISVLFDPCLDLIYLNDEANQPCSNQGWTFHWSVSGLYNQPLIAPGNPGQVRVQYGPGEVLCVQLSVTNQCGTTATVGEPICFITPDCTEGGTVQGVPINACNGNGDCPAGYECLHGVCNPISQPQCQNNFDCGVGYMCVNGMCVSTQGDECVTNANCPPGHRCKNGNCIPF